MKDPSSIKKCLKSLIGAGGTKRNGDLQRARVDHSVIPKLEMDIKSRKAIPEREAN